MSFGVTTRREGFRWWCRGFLLTKDGELRSAGAWSSFIAGEEEFTCLIILVFSKYQNENVLPATCRDQRERVYLASTCQCGLVLSICWKLDVRVVLVRVFVPFVPQHVAKY